MLDLCPDWLPKDIFNLIIFEYSPDPVHEYLQTMLCNWYISDIRLYVMPSANYSEILKKYDTGILLYFYMKMLCFRPRFKTRKSRKYLQLIDYSDFRKIEKALWTLRFTEFFGFIKPPKCGNLRISRLLT